MDLAVRFFRLTPNQLRLDAQAWQRSREQRECCVAACCEAGARQAAAVLQAAEVPPDTAEDAASPWLLPHLVTCMPLEEVPAVTTDPRLAPIQRAALEAGRPTEVPALTAPGANKPGLQEAGGPEARVVQALSAVAEAFRAVGQPEAGQRMLAFFTQAWSDVTARDAPATAPTAAPAATSGRKRRNGAAGHPATLSPGA